MRRGFLAALLLVGCTPDEPAKPVGPCFASASDVDDDGWRTAVGQDGPVQSAFFLQKRGDNDRFSFSTAGGRVESTFVPEVDRWYHVTGVRDAATQTHSLYVDGVLQDSMTQCLNPASEGPLTVGRARFGEGDVDFWAGAVDDVRVWDRALAAEEVAQVAGG